MKKIVWSIGLVLLTSLVASAQKYEYKVDLNKIEDDQMVVELKMPAIKKNKVNFHMPKMVPGTYAVYNFGRFISEFQALDKDGQPLEVERPDPNTWTIKGAKNCVKITYKVEDTWDTDKPNIIFEPAGINFDKERNVFVFNNHGIFGYFANYERLPYEITVERPKGLFGGTALKRIGGDEDTDIFGTDSYHSLVDNPILFAAPDTAHIKVGKADVLIHNYSPTGRVKAPYLVDQIRPILESQKEYLGGELPVDRYAFLIFLNKEGEMYLSSAAGALEHSYSSLYTLFEGEPASIGQTIRDVAAHEFFHIVTPLSIHSKEIHYFDFINPKMSQHLWLYEGGTEYAAQHVQVKQQLMPLQQFMDVMGAKMRNADIYDKSLSFTEMSKTCLDKNKTQYGNVYQKGALINMCLDLKLRILSEGKYGTQDMMRDLSQKYGIEKPFNDKCLFKEIGKITGYRKEMKDFFKRYVAGTEALPIKDLVAQAGITYQEEGIVQQLSPFGFDPQRGITMNIEQKLLQIIGAAIDGFGKDVLGLKDGDLIKEWNGQEVSLATVQSVLGQHAMSAAEGDMLNVTVLRKNDKDEYEAVKLKGTLKKMPIQERHAFQIKDKPSEQEMKIRKSWLGDYIME